MAINGRNYGSNEPQFQNVNQVETPTSGSKGLNLGKVFGVMFIWLLFTAGIAFLGGYLFSLWLAKNFDQAYNGIFAVMIVSGISLIILTFVIQLYALRKDKGMLILSSLYVLAMGILCSSMTIFIDWQILGVAFGITCAIFGVLALIGMLAKNVKPIAMVGMMVLIGALMVSLITWIVSIWLPVNATFLWILDFAIFGAMLLLIIVDMHNINKICESGQMSRNLTLYCALTLYTDFVYIFIRIAYYLAIAYGGKK